MLTRRVQWDTLYLLVGSERNRPAELGVEGLELVVLEQGDGVSVPSEAVIRSLQGLQGVYKVSQLFNFFYLSMFLSLFYYLTFPSIPF